MILPHWFHPCGWKFSSKDDSSRLISSLRIKIDERAGKMTWMRLWPHWWHNLRFCHGRVIEFFCRWRMRVHAIGMQGKHIEKPGAGYGLSWVWSGNGYHQQFARISYATWKRLCFRSAPAAPIRMLDRWIYIRMYDETWWGRGLFVWWSTRLEKRNIQEKGCYVTGQERKEKI